jgi:hypothetical protein
MAVKLTVFLFSSISILAFYGCGGDDASDEESIVDTTAAPTAVPTPEDPCKKVLCTCEDATCDGADIPPACMINCDEMIAMPLMVLQGSNSCEATEAMVDLPGICDNCACGPAADVSSCPKAIDTAGSESIGGTGKMENCEFILATPGFDVSDCAAIEANWFGGLAVCTGCDCPVVADSGYGYGTGRSLEDEVVHSEPIPQLKLSPEGARLLHQGAFSFFD